MPTAIRHRAGFLLAIARIAVWAVVCQGAGQARAIAQADDSSQKTANQEQAGTESAAYRSFVRAAELMASGAHERAAEQFSAVAEDAPGDPIAADALFSAAKLFEERLGDPARALVLYQRLYQRYPDSRTALAARRRADAIASDSNRDGIAALARFNSILQRFPENGERESVLQMEALLADYPDWAGRPRALLWLAAVDQRAGRHEQAMARYVEAIDAARASDRPYLFEAYRGAGDVALARGHFAEAEAYYRQMPVAGDPSRQRSLADSLAAVDRERLRSQLYYIALAIVVAVVIGLCASLRWAAQSWRQAAACLRGVPTEVLFMVPIAALLIGASLTSHYAIGPAVATICVGGVVVTWLSGAALDAGQSCRSGPKGWLLPVHAAATALAVMAVCYIALHQGHLIDMLIETVRFGPDF